MKLKYRKCDIMSQVDNNHIPILIVGHYTHDVIINSHESFQRLGGGVGYASAVAAGLNQHFKTLSKVGDDFRYLTECLQVPTILKNRKTTSFVNDTRKIPRRHQVDAFCEPFYPDDIDRTADIAIVCGVIGEILPETIKRLHEKSSLLIADIQGFIRKIDQTGRVYHCPLHETNYHDVIPLFDYLKVSDEELPFIDVEKIRRQTILLVTYGDNGCTVYDQKRSYHVPAYPVFAVDSTGAGDSFLMGFAVGLQNGFSVKKAVYLGHLCGHVTVQSVGIPAVHAFSHVMKALCDVDENLMADFISCQAEASLSLAID